MSSIIAPELQRRDFFVLIIQLVYRTSHGLKRSCCCTSKWKPHQIQLMIGAQLGQVRYATYLSKHLCYHKGTGHHESLDPKHIQLEYVTIHIGPFC